MRTCKLQQSKCVVDACPHSGPPYRVPRQVWSLLSTHLSVSAVSCALCVLCTVSLRSLRISGLSDLFPCGLWPSEWEPGRSKALYHLCVLIRLAVSPLSLPVQRGTEVHVCRQVFFLRGRISLLCTLCLARDPPTPATPATLVECVCVIEKSRSNEKGNLVEQSIAPLLFWVVAPSFEPSGPPPWCPAYACALPVHPWASLPSWPLATQPRGVSFLSCLSAAR